MKKEKQPAVYELIHSMERAEKGYFVKFANMLGKGGNHIVIFSILSDMAVFDKEILLKKLKKKKIHTSNLSVTLHNLYLFVLKSLRLFHEKNYERIQINCLLAEIDILIGKELKTQALKLLDKAESLAKGQHFYTALIEIQKIKAVQKVAVTKQELLNETQDVYDKVETYVDILSEELQFRKMHHLSLVCNRINDMDGVYGYSKIMQEISDHPLMNDTKKPVSFYSKHYKDTIKSTKAITSGDRHEAHSHYENIIRTWDSQPEMIHKDSVIYRKLFSNYLVNAIFIKKADDFVDQIKKWEKIPTRFQSDKVELFQNKLYLEQLYFLNYRKLDDAYKSIKTNHPLFEKYKPQMNFSRLVVIQYNYLLICFLKGHFHEALDWLNEILYKKNIDPRKNVRLFCRIMELVLHFELGNFELVESLTTSVSRKRKSDESFFDYTESILQYFKKMTKVINTKTKIEISENYLKELFEFKNNSPEPIGIEELIFWVSSKKNGTSIEKEYICFEDQIQ